MNKKILSLFLITLAVTNNAMPMTTPLHQAAQDGNVETLRTLLQQNLTDVNAPDYRGWTPLHFAASNGYVECTWELLQNGAEVNAKNICNWTPLHHAVYWGRIECIKLLLQNGASVTEKTKYESKTAKNFVRKEDSKEIVTLIESYEGILEIKEPDVE